LSPAFVKYEAPFHGTFNQHPLESLSPEQCRDMLAALAEAHGRTGLAELLHTDAGLARVRGIHHLLGGNPRAMAFVFRQLDEQRLDHFELVLADLADDLEPYVCEQLARLSPAQRAIMQLLAESFRPLTVTEIAERSFSSQASTSGALRHLRRDALVRERRLGREHYYELYDPLHRWAAANRVLRLGSADSSIEEFARVVREWYAGDRTGDFNVGLRYALPDARTTSLAADAGPALSREVIARLSEPERELVRKMLELHDDREGLTELGLSAESAARRSRG
jgi:DNA-binding transcriptional ArsR family regulator